MSSNLTPAILTVEDARATTTEATRDLLDLSEIHGWGQLTPREQRFARGIVAGMSQRAAAVAAGCTGEPQVIDVTATRLAAKPGVRRVISQALHRAGSDLGETVTKLSRVQARAFEAWEHAATREERAEAWRILKESSALLISIHARANITVSGAFAHAHTRLHAGAAEAAGVIPAEALPVLAQIRRSVIEDRIKTMSP